MDVAREDSAGEDGTAEGSDGNAVDGGMGRVRQLMQLILVRLVNDVL